MVRLAAGLRAPPPAAAIRRDLVPHRATRLILVLGCFIAIWGMALYVWNLPEPGPDEGVAIGAGIMVLWVVGTIIVLVAAAIGEVIRLSRRKAT